MVKVVVVVSGGAAICVATIGQVCLVTLERDISIGQGGSWLSLLLLLLLLLLLQFGLHGRTNRR